MEQQVTLFRIAKTILANEKDGLSKVRFAKTIYFVHKELIKNDLASFKEIQYIRMPLGPVPNGFNQISDMSGVSVSVQATGLAYNAQVYSLTKNTSSKLDDKQVSNIVTTLKNLKRFTSNQLVELSHLDDSWITHENSEKYYITNKDFKTKIPSSFKQRIFGSKEFTDQRMQAALLEGMLSDIVEESTALEYPTSGK